MRVIMLGVFCIFLGVVGIYADDVCRSGWFSVKDSCYLLGTKPLTWWRAAIQCRLYGARLATIESQEENMAILKHLSSLKMDARVWLGGTDFLSEGYWMWFSTLKPMMYTNWGTYEPNNALDGEDCLSTWFCDDCDNTWNDLGCDEVALPICEVGSKYVVRKPSNESDDEVDHTNRHSRLLYT